MVVITREYCPFQETCERMKNFGNQKKSKSAILQQGESNYYECGAENQSGDVAPCSYLNNLNRTLETEKKVSKILNLLDKFPNNC